MSEYHLQKRTLSHWSYVTWYDDFEQAQRNFKLASKEGNGYSWRLVEVTVIEQKLLDGGKESEPDGPEPLAKAAGEFKSTWGGYASPDLNNLTSEALAKPAHGLTGLVWVGNPVTKEKRRVVGFEAAKMLDQGWIKAGPRTVL